MAILLPQAPPKRPSFAQRLNLGVGTGLEKLSQMQQQRSAKEAISKSFGEEVANLSPELQKLYIEKSLQGNLEEQKQASKFANQIKMMKELGLDFGEGIQNGPSERNNPEGYQGNEISTEQDFESLQPRKSQLIPQKKINAMALVNPAVADKMQKHNDEIRTQQRHEEKLESRKGEIRRQEETVISKPILLEMNQIRKNIPLQEQAIDDIFNASPKVSALDYFADVTGFEPARSAEGAKLKTAIKDFFLSDLTRAGTRPNQWIEQQLMDALPKIGRSPEANLITAEGMKFKVDLAKKRVEAIDKLAEEDREKYGYVKADIDARAFKAMKKYVIDRQQELKNSIKKIKTKHAGKTSGIQMKSPDGKVYEIHPDDVDEALEHEYEFAN